LIVESYYIYQLLIKWLEVVDGFNCLIYEEPHERIREATEDDLILHFHKFTATDANKRQNIWLYSKDTLQN